MVMVKIFLNRCKLKRTLGFLLVVGVLYPLTAFAGPLDRDVEFHDRSRDYLTEKKDEAEDITMSNIIDGYDNNIPPPPAAPDNNYPESLYFFGQEEPYWDGNSTAMIEVQHWLDYLNDIFGYYQKGYDDFAVIGLCQLGGTSIYYPYIQYRFPYEKWHFAETAFSGQYLDNDEKKHRQSLLEANLFGPTRAALNKDKDGEPTEGTHDLGRQQAPVEHRRLMALTEGNASGERQLLYDATRYSQDVVPDGPDENPRDKFPEEWLLRRGKRSLNGFNVETHNFRGIAGGIAGQVFPTSPFGNCHTPTILEDISPAIHRSDNPSIMPLSKFKSFNDLFYSDHPFAPMDTLSFTQGICSAFETQGGRSMSEALTGNDPSFGLLNKLNPEFGGGGILSFVNRMVAGATWGQRLCVRGGSTLYGARTNITNARNFRNAAVTAMLRSNERLWHQEENDALEFTNTTHQFARFPYGNKPADMLKFEEHSDPALVSEPEMLLTLMTSYGDDNHVTKYFKEDPNRAVATTWKYIRCCPRGLEPIEGPMPQLKGHHQFLPG